MTYTNELLNMVKTRFSLSSEYQLAKKLEVNDSRLYKWRKELNSMDWEMAFRIADMLELDDQFVVHSLLEDKYENPRLISALHEGRPA
ncbi:transcriptional regulator [Photobacterium sanguinicancri]|uniref:Transcriptional regulator n=2 Tax=Photobacterium sanguinicancri TaxID=875932 RepID=A0AAW7YEZ4_9GAMM|nr:transcriptional regulator [Photobacterium sanguinicancri]MDO6496852.1 transcriptional regulator [Photobacterium sanguinicancri]MDO6545582.1 transcriptional regulator [Photobacterium sanguinicancri]